MHTPSRFGPGARRRLWICSCAILLTGAGAFLALDASTPGRGPLAVRLVELPPERTGLAFEHEMGRFAPFYDNVRPFMQAVSASAATADVDRDGLLDLYLTTAGHGELNALFRNTGDLRFERVHAPAIEDLNRDGFSSDCVFGDVDDDGWDDLLVGMISAAPRLFRNVPATDGDFRRDFEDVTADAGLPDYMNGFAQSFFDADRDGDLDLFLASYFRTHYDPDDVEGAPRVHCAHVPDSPGAGRSMPNDWGNATNGGTKHFLLGDGGGRFEEQDPAAWGFEETRFTFDAGTGDVNGDGWTDLYLANDFGPDQLYFNREGQRFEAIEGGYPTAIGRDSFKGMNADLQDIDHDGFPEIYVTNVMHPALPEGNILWRNRPDPGGDPFLRSFENVAAAAGVQDGGWGWGAKFVDLDLDGDVDLVSTNGYISGDPSEDYWYRLSRLVAGSKELVEDCTHWPAFEDASMCGHQVGRVFVNEGGRFHDRAQEVGLTRMMDGRGALVADFDLDGRPDILIVAQGGPPFLARNEHAPTPALPVAPHWIGLRLAGDGDAVNRSAIGTRVRISPARTEDPAAPRPQWREVSAGNGMSAQSMPWVLVGLGPYDGPVDVEVRWTDGAVVRLDGLDPDRYHDVERAETREVAVR